MVVNEFEELQSIIVVKLFKLLACYVLLFYAHRSFTELTPFAILNPALLLEQLAIAALLFMLPSQIFSKVFLGILGLLSYGSHSSVLYFVALMLLFKFILYT